MATEATSYQNQALLPKLARLAGFAITIACIVYVSRELIIRSGNLDISIIRENWISVVCGVLLWVMVNVLLGIGWKFIANAIDGPISTFKSIILSLRTQAAKYLPGNVFHFAGRVWFAREESLSAKQAGLATAGESLLLVIMAFAIGLPIFWGGQLALIPIATAIILLTLLVPNSQSFANRILERLSITLVSENLTRRTAMACVTYAAVLTTQTALFLLVADIALEDSKWTLLEAAQISSLSWAAGFLVIGSPGGLGVREAVMSLFAVSNVEKGELILVASGMRVCSIAGDLLSLALGLLLAKFAKTNGQRDM